MPIRLTAICIFLHDDKILVMEKTDQSGELCYRPLGGGAHYGEHSADAVVREIKEEISADITHPEFIGALENIFTLKGETIHRIVMVYDAKFIEPSFYKREIIHGIDDCGDIKAVWKPLSFFISKQAPLYPEGLLELLMK